MEATATLVRVRFSTARSGLCGCHLSGLIYEVSPEFAELVVGREQCAKYVRDSSMEEPKKKKR